MIPTPEIEPRTSRLLPCRRRPAAAFSSNPSPGAIRATTGRPSRQHRQASVRLSTKGVVMNITTTARHYELTPALKDYAEEKVQNLKRYFDHIVNAHVIFSLEKYRQCIEITLHVNGKDFVSAAESEDMYLSVDRAVEKLEEQLKRHAGRLKKRKRAHGLGEVSSGGVLEGE
jgi:ribosome hibernation promoting factor